jgi:hypothetical protein
MEPVKSKWRRCPECGLKIRGKNHENGEDHQKRRLVKVLDRISKTA